MQKTSCNTKGFALIEVIITLVVLIIIGAAGMYAYYHNRDSTKQTSNSDTYLQKNKGAPATDSYKGWKQYCSAQEKSCFKYPSDWTAKDVGAVDPAGDGLQITSPNGTVIWFQSAVSGLGGQCQPSATDVFIHKVVTVPKVANLYIVESGTDDAVNHIGLVNGSDGQSPKTGDTGSCVSAATFTSKHDPSMDAWFESNGISNFKLSDLSTAEFILKSYAY